MSSVCISYLLPVWFYDDITKRLYLRVQWHHHWFHPWWTPQLITPHQQKPSLESVTFTVSMQRHHLAFPSTSLQDNVYLFWQRRLALAVWCTSILFSPWHQHTKWWRHVAAKHGVTLAIIRVLNVTIKSKIIGSVANFYYSKIHWVLREFSSIYQVIEMLFIHNKLYSPTLPLINPYLIDVHSILWFYVITL